MNERKQNLEELKVLAKIEDAYKELGKHLFHAWKNDMFYASFLSRKTLLFFMTADAKMEYFQSELSKLKKEVKKC